MMQNPQTPLDKILTLDTEPKNGIYLYDVDTLKEQATTDQFKRPLIVNRHTQERMDYLSKYDLHNNTEQVRAIRQESIELFVDVTTAYELAERSRDAGALEFLEKSFKDLNTEQKRFLSEMLTRGINYSIYCDTMKILKAGEKSVEGIALKVTSKTADRLDTFTKIQKLLN